MTADPQNILVIKLSALGDFVQAMGPCAAIRKAHGAAQITLLTTQPYAEFASASGYFDTVWIDRRPRWWQAAIWIALKRQLDGGRFDRVYDLQTSDRSGIYFKLMRRPKPDWSGIAPGCSMPHANPLRNRMHTIDRQRDQLGMAGIDDVPMPNFDWIENEPDRFGLAEKFILFAPGGSAGRPGKRWSIEGYAEIAERVAAKGILPVLIGGADEAARNAEIAGSVDGAADLTGQTSIMDIARLARGAAGAVGNDNGPMHLVALSGCPSLVLFSGESDPALCAQRGPDVAILRRPRLSDLDPDEVEAAIRLR